MQHYSTESVFLHWLQRLWRWAVADFMSSGLTGGQSKRLKSALPAEDCTRYCLYAYVGISF